MKLHTFVANGISEPSLPNTGRNKPVNHVEYRILDNRRGNSKIVASDFTAYGSNYWTRSFAGNDFGVINMMLSTMMMIRSPGGRARKTGGIRDDADGRQHDYVLGVKGTMYCQEHFHSVWIGIAPEKKDDFEATLNGALSSIMAMEGNPGLETVIRYSVTKDIPQLVVNAITSNGNREPVLTWSSVPADDFITCYTVLLGRNFSNASAELYVEGTNDGDYNQLLSETWTPTRLHMPLFSYIVSSGDDDVVHHVGCTFRQQITQQSSSVLEVIDNKQGAYYFDPNNKDYLALANVPVSNSLVAAKNVLGAGHYINPTGGQSYVKV